MKQNLMEMIFVLDRSGSMQHLTQETIGGFNSLIAKQCNMDNETYITTILFDHDYEILHNHLPIHSIQPISEKEYYARGCTALLDAVGRTIDMIGKRLSETPEEERPSQILFVITTDGCENASQDYTKKRVKEMITLQQDTYKWKFLFLGANIDAFGEADSLGIKRSMAAKPSASAQGVKSSFKAVNRIAEFLSCPLNASISDADFEEICCASLSEIE